MMSSSTTPRRAEIIWISIMDSDSAVIGQVEDVVNEIRWKLSVNAEKLFKVCDFLI